MNLNLRQLPENLAQGIRELSAYYELQEQEDGVPVTGERGSRLEVRCSPEGCRILYPGVSAFFRGLMLAKDHLQENFSITETRQIPHCGVMLDLSRNGVMRVEALKKYIRQMAVMGLNTLYLYMEDVYEIPGRPYFGYMRGRYTKSELQEADQYGLSLGVELVPHIQVLGHMHQYIKWDEGMPMRDTEDILNVGEEETYRYIEDAIRTVRETFHSRKIHLGMDECGNLGSGLYRSKHEITPPSELYMSHLKRVCGICEKYGAEPIIYGDALFASLQGTQYAEESRIRFTNPILKQLPENLSIAYWRYDSRSYEQYDRMLRGYQQTGAKVCFWGGLWTWFGFVPDNKFTLACSEPGLMACKHNHVDTAVASIWGDDGCECSYELTALGLCIYSEHMYEAEVSRELLAQRLRLFTGASLEAFLRMSDFHNDFYPGYWVDHYDGRYYGKRYFWADILLGIMDRDLMDRPMSGFYAELQKDMEGYQAEGGRWAETYHYCAMLCDLLHLKCQVAEKLWLSYHSGDREFLRRCAEDYLPDLGKKYENLHIYHRKQWMQTYKPFGFEVLDIRYSGICGRIEYAAEKLRDYLEGRIPVIEELEPERLPNRCEWDQSRYHSIASTSFAI